MKIVIIGAGKIGTTLAQRLAMEDHQVTLVDIRYLHPDQVGDFVTFTDQDVLFLYSTLVLNNSVTFK